MQLTLFIPSHHQHWDAINGILGERVQQINACPLKKKVFSRFCLKLAAEYFFNLQKRRLRSITTLSMQPSNKRMDSTNAFVENEHQIWEMEWAMGNGKSVMKKFKTFALLLTEPGGKKSWQKVSQHATQVNGLPQISAKVLAFPSLL